MSGGSFDYLCFKEAYELFLHREPLCQMRDKLIEFGFNDAAKETESILLILENFEVRMQTRMDRLKDVWKAIEWEQSGDWGVEEVEKAIKKYREEL